MVSAMVSEMVSKMVSEKAGGDDPVTAMISYRLAAIFARLQTPASRLDAAAELALHAGVAQVLLFGLDGEVNAFLPAPGMPQTLRRGARWQAFLCQCAREGSAAGAVPSPSPAPASEGDRDVSAFGLADSLGTSIMVFLGGVPAQALTDEIGALLPLVGAKLAVERTALAADGHACAAREGNRRAGALNAALDVNRRELQAAYQSAERELVFRRAAEAKLRDADRRKDEFLAMLAHELRNPLAPISMAAQILKTGNVSAQRLQQTCAIIDRQISHMTSLLDDLLDVSRVTGGMVTLAQELHDMRAIARDAIEQARPLLIARGHHLIVELSKEPVKVCGDDTRLVQIVTNLLNNATKYTPHGGEIALRMTVTQDHVDLKVRDNGIGIDSALLPHVFDLFIQGERSSDRAQGGLGLGLALVKSLVERHGGTVEAHSAGPGSGSEFTVRLPRHHGEAAAPCTPCEPQSIAGNAPSLPVMIVDDNADAAHTLSLFLEARGHKVRVAFNGRSALGMASDDPPRVLVLDIGLPDIDGLDLARSLRALPQTADAVFIALTGYGQPEDRERSRAAGFDHHLTKPVDAERLAALLAGVKPA
jgi:signal transduction histidine kinase/ActR/RegA family two-component response regulator